MTESATDLHPQQLQLDALSQADILRTTIQLLRASSWENPLRPSCRGFRPDRFRRLRQPQARQAFARLLWAGCNRGRGRWVKSCLTPSSAQWATIALSAGVAGRVAISRSRSGGCCSIRSRPLRSRVKRAGGRSSRAASMAWFCVGATSAACWLPGVAAEHDWDAATFLDHVCLKAGLHPSRWQEDDSVC